MTTHRSQGYVLAARMRTEEVKHDEKVLADIDCVRITSLSAVVGEITFCPVLSIKVKEIVEQGDGKEIVSHEPVVKGGLLAPKQDGTYRLKNVLLKSNGVLSIEATPATKWQKA